MPDRNQRRLILVLTTCMAAACASAGNAGDTGSAPHDRTQITMAEMKELSAMTNLYDVVQRLHPEWLTARGANARAAAGSSRSAAAESAVHVYVDTQLAGNTDVLRQFSLGSASLIKFYSAAEAQTRFGLGNLGGAIQIMPIVR